MKREIKFRGKRIDNGEWVYGSYLAPNRISWIRYDEESMEFKYPTAQIDPSTVGQYTGLKDQNGVEIYEGDICFNHNKTLLTLKNDPRTYEVVFNQGKFDDKWLRVKPGFEFKKLNPDGVNYMRLIFNESQIEVTGNIHDK